MKYILLLLLLLLVLASTSSASTNSTSTSVSVSVSVSSYYIKILHIVIVSQLRIRLSGLPADRPMALELEHFFFFETVVNKLNFLS